MFMSRLSCCFYAAAMIIVCRSAVAQDSSQVWVKNIGVPHYFAILVDDVDEAATWYRTVFGLDELDRKTADDSSWQIVNLRNENLFVELIRDNRSQKVERAQGFFKVGFQVPNVEAVADYVARVMGERPRIVDDIVLRIRILQLKDPAGNTIQLHSHLDP